MSRAIRTQLSVLDDKQAGRSTRKNSAVPALVKAKKRDIGKMKLLVNALKLLSGTQEQAAIRCCPDVSPAILEYGANELVGQSLVRAEGAKTAIPVMEQSSPVSCSPE